MKTAQLRTGIFALASDAIQEWFDPDDHSARQKYILEYGNTYCKLMIYRNCFAPCMSYDTYFEDFHVIYSDMVGGQFLQSSFYINRDNLGKLYLPEKKFHIERMKSRPSRPPPIV